MSSELVDLIENFLASELGVGLSPEAIKACSDMSFNQFDLLSSHISEWDRGHHEVLVRRTNTVSPSTADREERPFSAMFTHPYNGLKPTQVEHIKRQLLFFPSVAIVRPDFQNSRELSTRISSLKAFVLSVIELEPLLRDGTVELIPLSGFYSDEIEGGAAIIRRACQKESRVVEWLGSQAGHLVTDFSAEARRNDPYFDAGVRIASALTYGHELVATHPFVGALYAQLLHGGPPIDPENIAIGTNLERISLPGLSGLEWQDIRAIRQDKPSFRRWRSDLGEVIAGVDPDLPPAEFARRFNATAKARLARAALDVDRELKDSAALTRARTGAVTFAIGAVAAVMTIATFGPPAGSSVWTAVLKAAETGGATAALQFLWASKRSSGKKALRSHYSVFAPE